VRGKEAWSDDRKMLRVWIVVAGWEHSGQMALGQADAYSVMLEAWLRVGVVLSSLRRVAGSEGRNRRSR